MKLCDTCYQEDCHYSKMGRATECDRYKQMAEYKITSEEIDRTHKALVHYCTTHQVEDFKKIFPDHFQPKQEYCCAPFGHFVASGLIEPGDPHEELWVIFKEKPINRMLLKCCPKCGKKPIEPIK